MISEEILDALASPYFKALRNYVDRWGIAHLSFDGVSIGEIFDDDLDALLQQWINLNETLTTTHRRSNNRNHLTTLPHLRSINVEGNQD